MRKSVKIAAMSAGLAMTLGLAACGGDSGGGDAASDRLDGVSVSVGSKDFTENILLGEMYAQALENEGADVDKQINLGGTSVNRDALTSGDIDVYPDYNGTGWTVFLGNEDPSSDPTELYEVTAEADLAENNIKWIGTSEFNNTYGFAANGDLAEAEGGFDFDSMAAYLEANPDATVCMETEFPDRPDGLVLWEESTGYELPRSQSQILDTGLIYTETADNNCDFGEVFTTDGRITALNLELVEDPGAMIIYNASFTMDNELYDANADVYDELGTAIFDGLDNDKMAELNAMVDVDGMPAERVAQTYLEDIGVL
ncbi:glycine betaine ABC transporter substrate-binding protein [Aeromicrobium sp. CF3.5]|uniref:glycine betaine ABC transporter substrate-binding protein n=1 Tax=Aeromicrobium sp. CF3.5 TaxID=3373078 RepID=UPI003EE52B3D